MHKNPTLLGFSGDPLYPSTLLNSYLQFLEAGLTDFVPISTEEDVTPRKHETNWALKVGSQLSSIHYKLSEIIQLVIEN